MSRPSPQPSLKRIGLTAGIACGKSLVVKCLQDLGIPTLDVDQTVHQLYQHDPELQEQIQNAFGPSVIEATGQINRKAVAAKVFQDPALLKQLEGWIHPKVRQALLGFFEQQADQPVAVVEIPLLFESAMDAEAIFDEIWVVQATPQQQVERLMRDKGYSEAEALARMAQQWPLEEKIRRADVVIDNTGTPEATCQQVRLRCQGLLPTIEP